MLTVWLQCDGSSPCSNCVRELAKNSSTDYRFMMLMFDIGHEFSCSYKNKPEEVYVNKSRGAFYVYHV